MHKRHTKAPATLATALKAVVSEELWEERVKQKAQAAAPLFLLLAPANPVPTRRMPKSQLLLRLTHGPARGKMASSNQNSQKAALLVAKLESEPQTQDHALRVQVPKYKVSNQTHGDAFEYRNPHIPHVWVLRPLGMVLKDAWLAEILTGHGQGTVELRRSPMGPAWLACCRPLSTAP